MSARFRRVALLLLVVEVAGVAWLVLNPSSATPTAAVLKVSAAIRELGGPTWLASTTGWEYVLNIGLFLPLGLLAALVWHRMSVEGWVIVGFLISAGLELVQLVVLGERTATLTDISANTIGTFVGAAIGGLGLEVVQRRSALRRFAPGPA